MNGAQTGHFQFCIDVGLPAHQTALAEHREMNLLTEQLAGTFARHGISATWATTQSVNAPLADIIFGTDENHELALLGERSWLSDTIRRQAIIDHFTENMQHAADVGKPLTTLVLRDAAPVSLYPVFKKRGIRTLRPVVAVTFSRKPQKEPAVRDHDMWVAQSTAVFPAHGRFLGRLDPGFRGKQILNRTRHKKTSEQLTILASEMMKNPTATLRSLDRILRIATKFKDQGALKLETIDQATVRWAPVRRAPQRSILRPAA